jgi:hypothetical protein
MCYSMRMQSYSNIIHKETQLGKFITKLKVTNKQKTKKTAFPFQYKAIVQQ